MIDRPTYLEKLLRWKDRDVIKVITGVRRCGKSTLLKLYMQELASQGVPSSRIIHMNFEQLEYEHLLDCHRLHDEILERVDPHAMNYVLLDEVQNVPDFQRAVDSLYVRDNIDLYITGSNAMLLGGTLATLLSGRYVEISMLPLSFAEYRTAVGDNVSLIRAYRRYIERGGFPATIDFAHDSLALHDYLEGIINTILFKDVAQRLNIANNLGLSVLVRYLFDNIGNLTSAKKISDTLTSENTRISVNTVMEYLSALCNSFIVYPSRRYDVRGRRVLKLQQKYYAVDLGMRRSVLSGQVRDTGRILENVIFLELKRRYGEVYVGSIDRQEVDFVAVGSQGPEYYQVSESVLDEGTRERELSSLRSIRDNRPKILLTLDDIDPIDHDGIRQLNALEWLVGDC